MLNISDVPRRKKSVQIQTDGSGSLKSSIIALWGPKSMENVVPLNPVLEVEPDSAMLKRRGLAGKYAVYRRRVTPTDKFLVFRSIEVKMSGFVSKFAVGSGRSSNDRQFFFVNNRPCNLPKVTAEPIAEEYA